MSIVGLSKRAEEVEEAAVGKGGLSAKEGELRDALCCSSGGGREAASHFLTRRGYNILEQGWRYAGGSVDLVALDGDCLVLADVLMGDGVRGAGFPHEPDVGASRERMEAAAVAYLREAQEAFSGLVRFDVVSILPLSEDRAFVRHHIGAFSGA